MNGITWNPGGTIGVDVWNVVVMLTVNPVLAAVSRGVDAVAVVFLFVFGHVASGVLAESRNDDVVLVLGVDRDATVGTFVLFVNDGTAFLFVVVIRGNICPSSRLDVVLVDTALGDVVRARAVGKGYIHVAVHDFGAVWHQACGNSLDDFPSGTAVVAHLQVILGFRSADVDCRSAAVGELALSRVEKDETHAIHAVQAAFGCGGKGDLVKACPGLAVVSTLVHALGAATAKNDVAHVRVYGQFFAGLAAHAVAVGEHFHVASVPSVAEIFAAEYGGAPFAKVTRAGQHVNALRVVRVECKGFCSVKAHIVLGNPVH